MADPFDEDSTPTKPVASTRTVKSQGNTPAEHDPFSADKAPIKQQQTVYHGRTASGRTVAAFVGTDPNANSSELEDHMAGSVFAPNEICTACHEPRSASVYCRVTRIHHAMLSHNASLTSQAPTDGGPNAAASSSSSDDATDEEAEVGDNELIHRRVHSDPMAVPEAYLQRKRNSQSSSAMASPSDKNTPKTISNGTPSDRFYQLPPAMIEEEMMFWSDDDDEPVKVNNSFTFFKSDEEKARIYLGDEEDAYRKNIVEKRGKQFKKMQEHVKILNKEVKLALEQQKAAAATFTEESVKEHKSIRKGFLAHLEQFEKDWKADREEAQKAEKARRKAEKEAEKAEKEAEKEKKKAEEKAAKEAAKLEKEREKEEKAQKEAATK